MQLQMPSEAGCAIPFSGSYKLPNTGVGISQFKLCKTSVCFCQPKVLAIYPQDKQRTLFQMNLFKRFPFNK